MKFNFAKLLTLFLLISASLVNCLDQDFSHESKEVFDKVKSQLSNEDFQYFYQVKVTYDDLECFEFIKYTFINKILEKKLTINQAILRNLMVLDKLYYFLSLNDDELRGLWVQTANSYKLGKSDIPIIGNVLELFFSLFISRAIEEGDISKDLRNMYLECKNDLLHEIELLLIIKSNESNFIIQQFLDKTLNDKAVRALNFDQIDAEIRKIIDILPELKKTYNYGMACGNCIIL